MRSIKKKIGTMGRPLGSLVGNLFGVKGVDMGGCGEHWVVSREWVVGVSGAMWVTILVVTSLCGTFLWALLLLLLVFYLC